MFKLETFGRVASTLVLSSLLAACGDPADINPSTSSVASVKYDRPAIELAQKTTLGQSLEAISILIAYSTVTFVDMAKEHGADKAKVRIKQEINLLLPQYQPQWLETLAGVYEHHLSTEELQSLAGQGIDSPFNDKLIAAGADINKEMKTMSETLLKEIANRALNKANSTL